MGSNQIFGTDKIFYASHLVLLTILDQIKVDDEEDVNTFKSKNQMESSTCEK